MGKTSVWKGFLKRYSLSAIIVCALLVPVSLSAQTVTLRLSNVTVQEAITALAQQDNWSISFDTEDVDLDRRISVAADNDPIEDVLKQIFTGQDVTFSVRGKRIQVTKLPPAAGTATVTRTVTGSVVDSEGEPLAGASVIVTQGTGVITDLDGKFEIPDLELPAEIEVSFLGFTSVRMTLQGNESMPLEIVLEESHNILDDVVVVGYASMKKRDLVGSVEQVGDEVITGRANGNLARSLQGEVTGLNITFTDSKPSRSASFNIRGDTSIGSGGSALVLIDGVEGDINTINPNDVESVSVLKDASSTAVYGARGAFGVILVTTKNPTKGRPVVTYDGSVTVNRRTVIPDGITDPVVWIDWWKQAWNGFKNGSQPVPDHVDSNIPYNEEIYQMLLARQQDPSLPSVVPLEGNNMFGWAYLESTNWDQLFYKDFNWSTEHNLSVSGGGDKADYYISGRFYDMDGIYRVGNESFKKYDLRAKGSLKIRPWLTITNNISVSITDQHEPKHSRDNFNVRKSIMHCAMPLSPVKNPDGTWTTSSAISGYASFSEGTSYRDRDNVYLREKVSLDVDIIKDVLKFQADYSFNFTSGKQFDVQNPVEYSKKPGVILLESETAGSKLTQVDSKTQYQAGNLYLTYTPRLGDNHSLTVLAGWNVEQQKYETVTVQRKGIILKDKPSFALMNGTLLAPSAGGNIWAYAGAFFRANYSYKGKYLAEVSGRYDGSSKFPSGQKWGFFPSASLGWRISDEPWMSWSKPALDNAKIRVSAGTMGNGNVSPYSYVSSMGVSTVNNYIIDGELATVSSLGSPVPVSLTWETVTTYDVGLDLDFFDNRLSFTGDYYRRYTSNMYTQSVALPSVYGTTPPKGNNAKLRTDGWELSLSWRDQFTLGGKPFGYSVKAMVWDSQSTVLEYINDTGSLGTVSGYISNGGTPSQYYVGMKLGEIWGYTVAGLFKDQADIDNAAVQTFNQGEDKITRPGQVKIADIDDSRDIGPGAFTVTDHGDLSIIGNQTPRYRFGINLAANWNGIGISIFLQGVGKRDWYPGSDSGYFWGKYGRPFFTFIPSIQDYRRDDVYSEEKNNWDTAYWPRLTTYQSNGGKNWDKVLEIPNTRYLQRASYIRIKNIQVDYTFNRQVCSKIGLQGLKIYLSGENLFTFTPMHKYAPNFDPEALSYDTDFVGPETPTSGDSYPILKSLTLGVNITF